MWKFCGKAQFPHSFRRFAFPRNFYTRKLGEISAFYAVHFISSYMLYYRCIITLKFLRSAAWLLKQHYPHVNFDCTMILFVSSACFLELNSIKNFIFYSDLEYITNFSVCNNILTISLERFSKSTCRLNRFTCFSMF